MQMAPKDGDTKIGNTSGQVAIGDHNTQSQAKLGANGDDDKPAKDLPWKIIGAVTATVGAIAAVIALFVA
jgi:hypothetical protein